MTTPMQLTSLYRRRAVTSPAAVKEFRSVTERATDPSRGTRPERSDILHCRFLRPLETRCQPARGFEAVLGRMERDGILRIRQYWP